MADLFAVANEKASAEDLGNVTRQIEAFWEKTALLLEPQMFDGGCITVIRKKHNSEFTRENAMLQQWSDKFDREASRRQLIVAMCKAELVAQVRTVFGQELVDYCSVCCLCTILISDVEYRCYVRSLQSD